MISRVYPTPAPCLPPPARRSFSEGKWRASVPWPELFTPTPNFGVGVYPFAELTTILFLFSTEALKFREDFLNTGLANIYFSKSRCQICFVNANFQGVGNPIDFR